MSVADFICMAVAWSLFGAFVMAMFNRNEEENCK